MSRAEPETESHDAESTGSLPRRVVRTVTPSPIGSPNAEMSAIGWAVFLGSVLLLLPMLPFVIALWAIGKLLDRVSARRRGQ